MGIWATQVTPRLVASGGEDEKIRALRARACAGLHGEVGMRGTGFGATICDHHCQSTIA